jgi:hypothetical protein
MGEMACVPNAGQTPFWKRILFPQHDTMNVCQSSAGDVVRAIEKSARIRVRPCIACILVLLMLVLTVLCWWKRSRTYRRLVRCDLPTVFWRPKFVYYDDNVESEITGQKKLPSSTITNILPRMQRLDGPYGMYGMSTAVVHVAHPVLAMALLGAASTKRPSGSLRPKRGSTPTPLLQLLR